MLSFLMDNISTIIVSALLVLVVTAAVLKMYKDKKAGKSVCGCKCSGCPDSEVCHGNGKKQSKG